VEDSPAVHVYDVASRTLSGTWTVGGAPAAVGMRRDGSEVLVLDSSGRRIVALNPATGAVLRSQALGVRGQKLDVDASGHRLLIGSAEGTLLTLDAQSWATISSIALGESIRSVAFWESASLAVVVQKKQDGVALVNVETGTVVARVGLDTDPERGAVGEGAAKAYVTTKDDLSVNQIDLATRRSDGRYLLPTEASAIVFDSTARVLYVTQPKDKALVRLDPAQNFLLGTLTLAKRLRDIAVNNETHEAAAIAEKVDELSRIRLADRSIATLALPAKPSRIAIDSGRNLAVIATKDTIRFADLASASGQLYADRIDLGADVLFMAVDSSRGLTLVATQGDRLHVVDNATRTRIATVESSEKFAALAVDSLRGLAYVATRSKKLLTFDVAARAFFGSADLAFRPGGMAIDPALNLAVLFDDAADQLHVMRLGMRTIVHTAPLPRHPIAVEIQPDTHIAVVASKEADQVSLFDLSTLTVTAGYATVDSPFALAISVRYNQALVLSGEKDEIAIVPLPNALPILDAIVPATAAAGAAGITITVNGAHFVDVSKVVFGTTELTTRWISASRLEADVPASLLAVAASMNVLVRTPAPGGGDSNSLPFVVAAAAPLLTAITPASVAANGQDRTFSLSGQNFFAGATVLFGELAIAPGSLSATTATVVAPGSLFQAAGTIDVRLRNADGLTSNAVQVTINAGPALIAVSPTSVIIDAQPHTFLLSGTGIRTGAVVIATGNIELAPTAVSANEVTVTVPGTSFVSPGLLTLAVRNSDGGVSNPVTVALVEPTKPFVYALQPSTVTAGTGETLVEISGASFAAGAVVRAGPSPAVTLAATVVNAQFLSVLVPANLLASAGELPLAVINPGSIVESARTSNMATLLVTPPVPLQIQGIVPATGQAGDTVIVFGQGFASPPTANSVTFAGASARLAAAISSATGTQLHVVVPEGVVTGAVQVTAGGTTVTGPVFTVAAPNELEYALIAGPSTIRLVPGGRASFEVQLGANSSIFTGLVQLRVEGLPAGVTASFQPGFVSAGQLARLELKAAATAAAGTFPLQVKGANISTTSEAEQTAAATLVVLEPGQTGITGRFVDAAGKGVAGVRVRAGDIQVVTDPAGNFLLTGLSPGELSLRLDATPANPLYPIWPFTLIVVEGKIIAIPDWKLSPPPADNLFSAINNATQDQQITDARYPGVALTLPAGVTITGWDGVKKTRIALQRHDPDQVPVPPPPIPTKSVYQIFFGTPMGGIPSAPIPVTLPNETGLDPGQQTELWYFDGSPMGGDGKWKMAGLGTVSVDGKTISTNPGTGIPRFCGVCGLACFKDPDPPNPPDDPPEDAPNDDPEDNDDPPLDDLGPDNDPPQGPQDPPKDEPGPNDPPPEKNPDKDPDQPKPPKNSPDDCDSSPPSSTGDPIVLSTGAERSRAFDMRIGGLRSVSIARRYSAIDAFRGIAGLNASLGTGWTLNYDVSLMPFDGPQKRIVMPGNRRVNFVQQPDGSYANVDNGKFLGARLLQVGDTWEVRFKSGYVWRFQNVTTGVKVRGGLPTFLSEVVDRTGNVINISRNATGRISAVGTQYRAFTFHYGSNGFISEVVDPTGRKTIYGYAADNTLESVTAPDGEVMRYQYSDDSEFADVSACGAIPGGKRLSQIQYAGGVGSLRNVYGPSKRVLRQIRTDQSEIRLSYKVVGACVVHVSNPGLRCNGPDCPDVDSWENYQAGWRLIGGTVMETTHINSIGQSTRHRFNAKGSTVQTTCALGQPTSYERDPVSNQVRRITNSVGQSITFVRNAEGQVLRAIDSFERMREYSYDSRWGKVATITRYDGTRPLTSVFSYEPTTGNLIRATDPTGRMASFSYTPRGELKTVTNAYGKKWEFEYDGAGDLKKIVNARSAMVTFGHDLAGRVTSVTNAAGFSNKHGYDDRGARISIEDPIGGITQFKYDKRRLLRQIINARGNTIGEYDYNDRGQLISRTDAVGRAELFRYEPTGDLAQVTDRAGQVHGLVYDSKRRLSRVTHPQSGSTTFAYDVHGRITGIKSADGLHEFRYDALGRLIEEKSTLAGGTEIVNYRYDGRDRRIARTINGAHLTEYAYDDAGRIAQIKAEGGTTSYDWDNAGRLESKTLPNGIRVTYAYDIASQLEEITYIGASGVLLEKITYSHDARGKRTAKSVLKDYPASGETPYTATYDAADRMRTLTLKATGAEGQDETYNLSYDLNGNLIAKSRVGGGDVTAFDWNDKGQLTGFTRTGSTPAAASFKYDALGRRVERKVNGLTTRFVYDGTQAALEIHASVPVAMVTGVGLDEVIARYANGQARIYLTDAIGSVFALADANRNIVTTRGYSPYGQTRSEGEASDDSTGFTAREEDGTGLYYYRARYYDPVLKRFISEDPIGMLGGLNVYSYVNGDPLGRIDPTGEGFWGNLIQAIITAMGISNSTMNSQKVPERPPVENPAPAQPGQERPGGKQLPDPAKDPSKVPDPSRPERPATADPRSPSPPSPRPWCPRPLPIPPLFCPLCQFLEPEFTGKGNDWST
jgi:RHS repeat-associated protein